MTTEQRLSDIEDVLLRMMDEKKEVEKKERSFSSIFSKWIMPRTFWIILGMIVGGLFINISIPTISLTSPNNTQQAAAGGAVIPFPSGSPLPSPSILPPGDSTAGSTASSSMSTSEKPSPPSLQAGSGQQNSQRLSRRTTLRRR